MMQASQSTTSCLPQHLSPRFPCHPSQHWLPIPSYEQSLVSSPITSSLCRIFAPILQVGGSPRTTAAYECRRSAAFSRAFVDQFSHSCSCPRPPPPHLPNHRSPPPLPPIQPQPRLQTPRHSPHPHPHQHRLRPSSLSHNRHLPPLPHRNLRRFSRRPQQNRTRVQSHVFRLLFCCCCHRRRPPRHHPRAAPRTRSHLQLLRHWQHPNWNNEPRPWSFAFVVSRFVQPLSQQPFVTASSFPAKIGLTGQGEVVGCGDTGLDVDSCFFWDEHQAIAFDGGR